MNKKENETFERLCDVYIPLYGPAKSKGGEILRAFCRIKYRLFNDGDHIGIGYGNETCNAPARFLIKNTNDKIQKFIKDEMWGAIYKEETVDQLQHLIYKYIMSNKLLSKSNDDDMWKYSKRSDHEYESDEEEYEEEDY